MSAERSNITIQPAASIFIIIVIALFLFDRGFSKLPLKGPLYVHDFLLILATMVALVRTKLTFKFPSIFLLCLISIIYLVKSIFFFDLGGDYFIYLFRQFFLFFYLICCYIIANKVFEKPENIDKAIVIIKKIAFWSIVFQLVYFAYLYATVPNYSPLTSFSYYSSVVVMGVLTYGAYALVFFKGSKRVLVFLMALIISGLLGHASSFFALFVMLLIHFYISFTPKVRFITAGVLFVILLLLFQLPQFNDNNATWRIIYWSQVVHRAVVDNFMIFGDGFGKPYMSLEDAKVFTRQINSSFMETGVNYKYERWVTPPHNSFLTIIHHIGVVPLLLLFLPIKGLFSQIFIESRSMDKDRLFLFFTLWGLIIWVFFNVILELPHSAIYFWFIYFTYIFYEKRTSKE